MGERGPGGCSGEALRSAWWKSWGEPGAGRRSWGGSPHFKKRPLEFLSAKLFFLHHEDLTTVRKDTLLSGKIQPFDPGKHAREEAVRAAFLADWPGEAAAPVTSPRCRVTRAQISQTSAPHGGSDQLPIFVVSLRRAVERRKAISEALEGLGLRYSIVDAGDAVERLPPEMTPEVDRARTHQLSDPEIGCALSHAMIYRKIVREQLPYALVLEDDAIPTPRLSEFVQGGHYRNIPLIQLYHQAAYVRRLGRRQLPGGVQLARLATSCSGSVAYSLSLAAAKALADATRPVRSKADWPLDLRDLGAAITRPVLVEHPLNRDGSVIHRGRSKSQRSLRRLFTLQYCRTKWRRLFAQRVRAHKVKC